MKYRLTYNGRYYGPTFPSVLSAGDYLVRIMGCVEGLRVVEVKE